MTAEILVSQPNFGQAVALYCEMMIEPAPRGWPVRKLLNQLGRYYAAYMLIRQFYAWQRADGPEPTLSRLQTVAGLSPRQTINFVGTLSSGKLVRIEPSKQDRRQNIVVPMPGLTFEIGRSISACLDGYRLLANAPYSADYRSDPDVIGGIIHRSADLVLDSGVSLARFPTVNFMTRYDCGYQLLVALMAAGIRRQRGGEPVPTSYSALAERFQISRSHVGNVLAKLRELGALEDGDRLSAGMVDEFERWCAAEMAHYGAIAF